MVLVTFLSRLELPPLQGASGGAATSRAALCRFDFLVHAGQFQVAPQVSRIKNDYPRVTVADRRR